MVNGSASCLVWRPTAQAQSSREPLRVYRTPLDHTNAVIVNESGDYEPVFTIHPPSGTPQFRQTYNGHAAEQSAKMLGPMLHQQCQPATPSHIRLSDKTLELTNHVSHRRLRAWTPVRQQIQQIKHIHHIEWRGNSASRATRAPI